jgi:deoxyribodipyrimidine photo-lyase
MNVLVWFKRDLRTADHPALVRAASLGRVIPLYIAEPALWAQPDMAGRHWETQAEALAELRADLAALGAPLVVRTGDAVEVMARLARAHRVTTIVSHQETGTLWTYDRDRRVAAMARAQGIVWEELPQSAIRRGQTSRAGWAPAQAAFLAAPRLDPPGLTPVAGVEPGLIPSARALGLAPDPCAHRQTGSRAAALALGASFVAGRGAGYQAAMASPVGGERACSRLSPHLAYGTLSVREAADLGPGALPAGALRAFRARLAWRDHFHQRLEDRPDMETRALHPACEQVRGDSTHLAAFAAGETGLPFADACLRYLRATGWLNFRARAMLVSVAVHHLGIDWRDAGRVLARLFTDYDPGIHWPQVQMQAGVTGINTLRIYNPVKQGQDHDADGAFTRRWVPELAAVPPALVHVPWRWTGAGGLLGKAYPEPLVDPAESGRAARETLWAHRRSASFAATAARIADRHSSPASTVFVNDRRPAAPRRRPPAPAQLTLDL